MPPPIHNETPEAYAYRIGYEEGNRTLRQSVAEALKLAHDQGYDEGLKEAVEEIIEQHDKMSGIFKGFTCVGFSEGQQCCIEKRGISLLL